MAVINATFKTHLDVGAYAVHGITLALHGVDSRRDLRVGQRVTLLDVENVATRHEVEALTDDGLRLGPAVA